MASEIVLEENSSAASTPGTGFNTVYFKTDGNLYIKNDAGTEIQIASSNANYVIQMAIALG